MTLDELPTNTLGVITRSHRKDLQDYCFSEGERVIIIAKALFDGPIAVRILSGGVFALRIEEAKTIEVNIL